MILSSSAKGEKKFIHSGVVPLRPVRARALRLSVKEQGAGIAHPKEARSPNRPPEKKDSLQSKLFLPIIVSVRVGSLVGNQKVRLEKSVFMISQTSPPFFIPNLPRTPAHLSSTHRQKRATSMVVGEKETTECPWR